MENFDNLKKTPLFEKHCALGGKIVDFGGWALPVQYTSILDECKAVRERAGLFDVSHMGEVDIIGNDAYAYMQKMVTNDVTSMTPGRCRYAVMCYDNGGAVDDVLIYKFADDHYMLIVNAGNTDKDFAWLSEHAFGDVRVINNSAKWGQLALQGPLHQAVLDAAGFEGEIPQKYYTFNDKMTVAGIPCLISRTGYTGEDGVELYCAAEDTVRLFEALLEAGKGVDMLPCGLGARDTLRFEASMPLYGHEMSADINPVECGLGFAIKLNKPGFIGKEALLKPQTRKRIGLKLVGKGIARPEADVLCNGEKSASSPRAAPHLLSAAIMQWHSFPSMPMKTALGLFPFAAESSTASLHPCPSTRGNKHIFAAHRRRRTNAHKNCVPFPGDAYRLSARFRRREFKRKYIQNL